MKRLAITLAVLLLMFWMVSPVSAQCPGCSCGPTGCYCTPGASCGCFGPNYAQPVRYYRPAYSNYGYSYNYYQPYRYQAVTVCDGRTCRVMYRRVR